MAKIESIYKYLIGGPIFVFTKLRLIYCPQIITIENNYTKFIIMYIQYKSINKGIGLRCFMRSIISLSNSAEGKIFVIQTIGFFNAY